MTSQDVFGKRIGGIVGLARPRPFLLSPYQEIVEEHFFLNVAQERTLFAISFDQNYVKQPETEREEQTCDSVATLDDLIDCLPDEPPNPLINLDIKNGTFGQNKIDLCLELIKA